MFAIVGIFLVFGAVIGGFLMEKGHMAVLIQPAELLIIAGAASGTLLVANPIHIIKAIAAGLPGAQGLALHKGPLSGHAQNDVPVSQQGAQGRSAAASKWTWKSRRRANSSKTIPSSSTTIMPGTLSATRCAWPSPAAWSRSTWIR